MYIIENFTALKTILTYFSILYTARMTRLFTGISSFFFMSPFSLQIRFLMIALTRRHQRRNLPKHLRSGRQSPELQRL